jgi:hypothetical protein
MIEIDQHQSHPLTAQDKQFLETRLLESKKDFKLNLVIFIIIWLISPYLRSLSDHDPLIDEMSYPLALAIMSIFFFGYLGYYYFKGVYQVKLALKTNFKIVLHSIVVKKKNAPLFHRIEFRLELTNKEFRYHYFPLTLMNDFPQGQLLYLEMSGAGKQLLEIRNT